MNEESKDYLEVKVFAEIVGKSIQAIYKRVRTENSKIKPFVKYFNDTPKIHKSALIELYGMTADEEVLNQTEKVSKPFEIEYKNDDNKALMKMIELLEGQIASQKEAIERRDKQIEELMELLKQHTKVLDQQQFLSAIDKKQVLELDSAEGKEKKKSFFERLFNKKTLEK